MRTDVVAVKSILMLRCARHSSLPSFLLAFAHSRFRWPFPPYSVRTRLASSRACLCVMRTSGAGARRMRPPVFLCCAAAMPRALLHRIAARRANLRFALLSAAAPSPRPPFSPRSIISLLAFAALAAEAFTVGARAPIARVRASSPSMYTVTLKDGGTTSKIECSGDTYVLDQAEEDA